MIELRSASLKALVSPHGATLAGLWARPYPNSLVLGTSDQHHLVEHLTYFGALVGPIANRIAGGRITIDGVAWNLEQNEGTNTLHSGAKGLHGLMWEVEEVRDESVTLAISLPDGFGGLPGVRKITARYVLNGTTLRLEIIAESDRATVMNIAHHPYWNLDGSDTVAAHSLRIPADTYLPTNAFSLPTGEVALVQGTEYDFRKTRKIPIGTTLDATLCLGRKRLDAPCKCAVLTAPGGPRLEVHTTEPGLQLYNGTGICDVPADLFDDRRLLPCAGVALEPQAWPDAPNHKGFPSIYLQKTEKYCQITEYRIYQ
ncbi:MAG: aldose epimerase family protein [Pseudomonadota bacterium]